MDIKEMTIKMLKNNLSEALRSTGKSAKEISKLTGLNYTAVLSYINGTNFPYIKNFDILVKTLGLDEYKIMNVDAVNDIIDKQKKK